MPYYATIQQKKSAFKKTNDPDIYAILKKLKLKYGYNNEAYV